MTVRAKFRVLRHEQTLGSPRRINGDLVTPVHHAVVLNAVYGDGDPENERFFAATPNGEIKISMISEETAKTFQLGKAYYVDFIPAE